MNLGGKNFMDITMKEVAKKHDKLTRCDINALKANADAWEKNVPELIAQFDTVFEKLAEFQQDPKERDANGNLNARARMDSCRHFNCGPSAWPAKLAFKITSVQGLLNQKYLNKKAEMKTIIGLLRKRHFQNREIPENIDAAQLEAALRKVHDDLKKNYSF